MSLCSFCSALISLACRDHKHSCCLLHSHIGEEFEQVKVLEQQMATAADALKQHAEIGASLQSAGCRAALLQEQIKTTEESILLVEQELSLLDCGEAFSACCVIHLLQSLRDEIALT